MKPTADEITEHLYKHLPRNTKEDLQIFLKVCIIVDSWYSLSAGEREKIQDEIVQGLLKKLDERSKVG